MACRCYAVPAVPRKSRHFTLGILQREPRVLLLLLRRTLQRRSRHFVICASIWRALLADR
jgi:hypothetical protein